MDGPYHPDYIHNMDLNNEELLDEQIYQNSEQHIMAQFNEMIRNQKNKTGKLLCTINGCNKEFSSNFCLKRHYLTIHLGFKRFKCELCDRRFAQKQYLTEHINTHT